MERKKKKKRDGILKSPKEERALYILDWKGEKSPNFFSGKREEKKEVNEEVEEGVWRPHF